MIGEEMTENDALKALQGDLTTCPFCGGQDLDRTENHDRGSHAIFETTCANCCEGWAEKFIGPQIVGVLFDGDPGE